MKRAASRIGTFLIALWVAFLPRALFAQFTIVTTHPVQLTNPLGQTNLLSIITGLMPRLIGIATPIAAVMIIVGAFYMLFAGGDPAKFGTGKNIILYTAIGYAIILIAGGIPLLLQNILS
ncbi:MAG: hypothetical protein AAB601_01120 [Patescibacteria group bacterium]